MMKSVDDAYPTKPLMAVAWLEYLEWAWRQEEAVNRFNSLTGLALFQLGEKITAKSLMEVASAEELRAITAFVSWFNEKLWLDDPFR